MRPCTLRRFLAAMLMLLPAVACAAPPVLFGYGAGFSELYRVNLATAQSTRIGPVAGIGFNDVEGLALSPDGVLFGVVDQTMHLGGGNFSATTDFLIRINPSTGTGTLVGQMPGLQGQGTGTGQLDYGLAFTCDGRLWMSSDTTGNLWEVDRMSAAVRLVGNTGASISGLAARGNVLFGVSVDPLPRLYRIDPATAAAVVVGPLDVGGTVANAGLDFDAAGVLYATLDPGATVPGFSRVVRIDPTTGAGSVVAQIPIEFVTMKALAIAPTGGCQAAAAIEPTPVPGPMAPWLVLLGIICAGLGVRRLAAG
jgi:hypothetical protein